MFTDDRAELLMCGKHLSMDSPTTTKKGKKETNLAALADSVRWEQRNVRTELDRGTNLWRSRETESNGNELNADDLERRMGRGGCLGKQKNKWDKNHIC
jgi:hypothetical protein